MNHDIVISLASLFAGALIGYVVAAHNRKANKEQVAALEAKLEEISAHIKGRVNPETEGSTEAPPATIDRNQAK